MQEHFKVDLKLLYAFIITTTVIWTLIFAASLTWNIQHEQLTILDLAKQEARAYFDKNLAFRLWATSHGGVYVKVDERTPPNPHLSHIPERDLVTPSGKQLTLMNPAYMLRQLMEQHGELNGVKSKITSSKYFNPLNKPDAWEENALKAFKSGQPEISEHSTIDNSPYLRFIRPLFIKEGCLKCHINQGYELGDLRGGISIAIPLGPYHQELRSHLTYLTIWHILLWCMGLGLFLFLTNRGRKMILTRGELEKNHNKTNQQMALILESLNEGVFGLSQQGECTFINPAACRMCGYTKKEFLNKNIHNLIHHTKKDGTPYAIEDCPLAATLKSGISSKRADEVFWRKDGSSFPVEYNNTALKKNGGTKGGVVIFRDLTLEFEKEEIEKQLWQTQKLESIGTLAGGIAHDFNNILSVILGYADLAVDNIPDKNPAIKDIQQIVLAGKRAKKLVEQILTFSRQSDQQLHPIKVQPVIKECLKLLRASIPTTIELQQNIDETCKKIQGDPTKLHQIIMNLCTNAYHAMREQGGVINVSLSRIDLCPKDLGHKVELAPGVYLKLTVTDTGGGIDPVTLKKIFDPYFTTKEKGDGTGLGLALVHSIVKSLKGAVTVYSEVDHGTAFKVYLPEIVDENIIVEQEDISREMPRGNERILVVDDEEVIALLTEKMLEKLGYKVTSFTSSMEALNAFQNNPGDFDLIITDMTMPEMTGMELCQKIIKIAPETPIIICTGFSELITNQKAESIGAQRLIMKPIIRKDMARAVRDVLDAQKTSQH